MGSVVQKKDKGILHELYARWRYEYDHLRPLYHYMERSDDMKICEVGVGCGENALHLLKSFNVDQLVLVDPYTPFSSNGYLFNHIEQGSNRRKAHRLLCDYDDVILWVEKSSVVACERFHDGFFDLVYVDGDHSVDAVYSDLCCWYPRVKSGGVLGGHDFNVPSVMWAVSRFADENNLSLQFVGCDWWIKKEEQL